ncbi:MAG: glycosyltransferase family 9 protein [Bdellovibrionales bacterium]|nr:glycosyltransferase family 9 protein [Bdellovibrionales bacterium]
MKVALVKPDHIGDLVLSIPAIRALIPHYDITLYCNPSTLFLAEYLFPEIKVKILRFAHLDRTHRVDLTSPDPQFEKGDVTVFLRKDSYLENFADMYCGTDYIMVEPTTHQHETEIQKKAVWPLIGNYSRTKHFLPKKFENFDFAKPVTLGLCPAAGFSGNVWPFHNWVQLGKLYLETGARLLLIGGLKEQKLIQSIRSYLGSSKMVELAIGDGDINGFLAHVSEADYIIASDSGTAHLCSLVRPIVSIFGPSPPNRFAPFGRYNLVLFKDYYCSPCLQHDKKRINHCISRECITSISPHAVNFFLTNAPSKKLEFKVIRGASHQRS